MSLGVLLGLVTWWFWSEEPLKPAQESTSASAAPVINTAEPAEWEPAVLAADIANTVQRCPALQNLTEQFASLRSARTIHSEKLVRLMRELSLQPELQLAYLLELGGDIAVMRQGQHQVQMPNDWELFAQQNPVRIAQSDMALVKRATEQHDYRALQSWLLQYPQPENVAKLGFLQFSLLQVILQLDPLLQPSQLQQLFDSQLVAGFPDLLLMTRMGRDLQLIDMLQQSYAGNLAISWRENGRFMNLTLLAAQRADSTLFDYWLAQGVPAGFGPIDDNAFDLLPLPASQDELQQQLPIVRTLLRQQLAPVSAERQWFWLQHLPPTESAQLQSLLQYESVGTDPVGSVESAWLSQALSQTNQQVTQILEQWRLCQGQNSLPDLIAPSEPETPMQRLISAANEILQKTKTDAVSIEQLQRYEQMNARLQQFIRNADWQGLDAYIVALLADQGSQFFKNRRDVNEHVLLQMLRLKAAPEEIIRRLKATGKPIPKHLLFFIEASQDPNLVPALKKAGYHIRARPQDSSG